MACGVLLGEGWNLCLLHLLEDCYLDHQQSPVLGVFVVTNYFDASDALARPGVVQGARPPRLGLKCHQGKHSLLAG